MEANLWGAVGLTKAVLPSMVDEQEGHVVVIGGDNSLSAPEVCAEMFVSWCQMCITVRRLEKK